MTHQVCEVFLHGGVTGKTVGLSENQATRQEDDLLADKLQMFHILFFHIFFVPLAQDGNNIRDVFTLFEQKVAHFSVLRFTTLGQVTHERLQSQPIRDRRRVHLKVSLVHSRIASCTVSANVAALQ